MYIMKKPSLSRSISRATLLSYCQKKYYFSYYTSFLNQFWFDFYKKCLLIKNLSSIDMRLGQKVHGMMSDYLTNFPSNDIEMIKENAVNEIEEEYKVSKQKDYRSYDRFQKFWLSEHYYQEDCEDKFQESKKRAIICFNNFLQSDLHKQILSYFQQDYKIFVEPKVPDFERMKMFITTDPELSGITLRAQPDFWVMKSTWLQKEIIIYDRKTGRVPQKESDKISEQLKVYAYKTLQKIWMDKFDNCNISCYEVYLRDMSLLGWKIKLQDIYDIHQKISLDVLNQKRLLENMDPQKNIPLPITNYSRTNHKNKCDTCRFRKVCWELAQYE